VTGHAPLQPLPSSSFFTINFVWRGCFSCNKYDVRLRRVLGLSYQQISIYRTAALVSHQY
jgi:hypothetical protein